MVVEGMPNLFMIIALSEGVGLNSDELTTTAPICRVGAVACVRCVRLFWFPACAPAGF